MYLGSQIAFAQILLFLGDALSKSTTCSRLSTSPQWTSFLKPSLFPYVPPYLNFAPRTQCRVSIPKTIRNQLLWGSTLRESDMARIHSVLRRTGFSVVPRTNGTQLYQSFDRYDCSNAVEDKMNPQFTSPEMKLNYLPNIMELNNKIRLSANQKRFIFKFGSADFPYVIPTFAIPDERLQFKSFCNSSPKSFWVQKPSNLSMSEGIRFFEDCQDFDTSVSVIQPYIKKPLIFKGRKMELRKYGAVTGFDPLRIYVLNDEFVKLSLKNYSEDPSSLSDVCHHTPWSPRCKRTGFGRQPFGRYTSKLPGYFQRAGVDLPKIRNQMEDAIIKTFMSVQASIAKMSYKILRSTYNAYNFVAFDFIIDQSGHLWLIEVNRRPGLGRATGKRIKDTIASQFTIAGYQLPSSLSTKAKKLVLKNLPQSQNLNDPTFDEKLYTVEKEISSKEYEFTKNPPTDLSELLINLTPNEVRLLIVAEDELNRLQNGTKRIFPSMTMDKYFKYIEYKPYYYWLFSAWEKKYGNNRKLGIDKLRELAQQKYHLRQ